MMAIGETERGDEVRLGEVEHRVLDPRLVPWIVAYRANQYRLSSVKVMDGDNRVNQVPMPF